ncbi:hypothetical protein GTY65_34025 [Streptomyces sp. SID8379]|uniref:hypothetical protein n=1 Tax=unclassified Streptomyces TaxID=2593676 RepID=UPI00037CC53C|nr:MULTISPECIES: hypothetical protein [unclassified Streptomyces]MYW69055.1 hypothetical protein [Streptomyces sp. SID8379]
MRALQRSVWEDQRDPAWKTKRIFLVRTALVVALVCIPALVVWPTTFPDRHTWLTIGQTSAFTL